MLTLIFTKRTCWIASLRSLNFKKINGKLHMKFCKHKHSGVFTFSRKLQWWVSEDKIHINSYIKTHNCLCFSAHIKSWMIKWIINEFLYVREQVEFAFGQSLARLRTKHFNQHSVHYGAWFKGRSLLLTLHFVCCHLSFHCSISLHWISSRIGESPNET